MKTLMSVSPRWVGALVLGGLAAVMPASAHAAEEASGLAALGLNLPGLIAQLVNFTILLVILRLFLFKPIMKVVDERKRRIEEGLQASEQAAKSGVCELERVSSSGSATPCYSPLAVRGIR